MVSRSFTENAGEEDVVGWENKFRIGQIAASDQERRQWLERLSQPDFLWTTRVVEVAGYRATEARLGRQGGQFQFTIRYGELVPGFDVSLVARIATAGQILTVSKVKASATTGELSTNDIEPLVPQGDASQQKTALEQINWALKHYLTNSRPASKENPGRSTR